LEIFAAIGNIENFCVIGQSEDGYQPEISIPEAVFKVSPEQILLMPVKQFSRVKVLLLAVVASPGSISTHRLRLVGASLFYWKSTVNSV